MFGYLIICSLIAIISESSKGPCVPYDLWPHDPPSHDWPSPLCLPSSSHGPPQPSSSPTPATCSSPTTPTASSSPPPCYIRNFPSPISVTPPGSPLNKLFFTARRLECGFRYLLSLLYNLERLYIHEKSKSILPRSRLLLAISIFSYPGFPRTILDLSSRCLGVKEVGSFLNENYKSDWLG